MRIDEYKVDLPEGQSGMWRIERFTVSERESEVDALRSIFSFGGRGRHTPVGTYTRLCRGMDTIMSDTPDEIRDHMETIRRANGICLVNGLGLGVVVNGMLMKDNVERVDCVEKSPDVISLVAPHWQARYGDRLRIIEADALTYKPPRGVVYDVAWHDIWDNICGDNLDDMKRLHRVYGRRCRWQGSWARRLCELADK